MTLIEFLLVAVIIAVMAALSVPLLSRGWDRLAVRRASWEISGFYRTARLEAVYRGSRVRIEFSEDTLRAITEGLRDSMILVLPGPGRYKVQLAASRQVVRIRPTGLGWGGANTKLILRRGMAAESLATSRLGRLRRMH